MVALIALLTLVAPPEPPRLVVLLVVDQFRGDYAEMYGHQWSRGLARLFGSGATFPLAAYPYTQHRHVPRSRDDRHRHAAARRTA